MTIIGLDTSYTRTGISVAIDGKLEVVRSIKFTKCKSKPEKRRKLKQRLKHYIELYNPDYIVIERTRQFSTNGKQQFFQMPMIKAGISLLTVVIDVAFEKGIPVYSVDTRSWKSKVVGTSKHKGDKKQPTIDFVESLGFDMCGDDDAADSACIALFKWYSERKIGEEQTIKLLKLEE